MIVAWRHQHDTVPEANVLRALRAGGEEHLRCRGMGVFLEEMVLDLPGEVDAEPVGELDLVERLLKEPEFVAVMPRPRELVLVKDAEFHGLAFRRPAGVGFLRNGRTSRSRKTSEHSSPHPECCPCQKTYPGENATDQTCT